MACLVRADVTRFRASCVPRAACRVPRARNHDPLFVEIDARVVAGSACSPKLTRGLLPGSFCSRGVSFDDERRPGAAIASVSTTSAQKLSLKGKCSGSSQCCSVKRVTGVAGVILRGCRYGPADPASGHCGNERPLRCTKAQDVSGKGVRHGALVPWVDARAPAQPLPAPAAVRR